MPNVVSGVHKTVKRAVKRKVQGVANRVVDRAAGHLAKRANEASLIYWVCKEMYVPILERPRRRRGLPGPPGQRGGNILWMSRGLRPYKRLRRPRRAKRLKRR